MSSPWRDWVNFSPTPEPPATQQEPTAAAGTSSQDQSSSKEDPESSAIGSHEAPNTTVIANHQVEAVHEAMDEQNPNMDDGDAARSSESTSIPTSKNWDDLLKRTKKPGSYKKPRPKPPPRRPKPTPAQLPAQRPPDSTSGPNATNWDASLQQTRGIGLNRGGSYNTTRTGGSSGSSSSGVHKRR